MKRKKILIISDHPLSPSGVGTQTKYFIEALLKTGRYEVVCLGGAIKHNDYEMVKVDPWGDLWRIFPVDGYGSHELIRSILRKERPDALWFMTDPRFFDWLWEIENEVRAVVPMIYYHVWDNYPVPHFNAKYYDSTDEVIAISKVTDDILSQVSPNSHYGRIPHAVNHSIFHKFKNEELESVKELRDNIINSSTKYANPNKKIFFWNNRNARRKQSGTVVWWFKEVLDEVGHDKATLLMHTDAADPHGQDLPHLIDHLGVDDGQILLSTSKVPPEHLANVYNACDYTINISDAEGFGLSTLESLMCGTPVIVNMTGGLQEQVTDGTDWFGWGIQPTSKSVIGSLSVPYIYEDRLTQKDFHNTIKKALKCSKKAYENMSQKGMKYVMENYNFEDFEKSWVTAMDDIIEKHGSWENRKNYKRWHLMEVAAK